MAQRKTQAQWFVVFDLQKQSGLSVDQSCQHRQLSEAYYF
jgi:hypothetical protein